MNVDHQTGKTRHIVSLSGGKDSSALAIYLRDRIPDVEYVFCDTGEELPETYRYLDKLEAALQKRIHRLNPDRPFEHHLKLRGGYLPSPRMRWCTRELKLKPFERFVGDDPVRLYVAIRADEDREGYISRKPNITSVFPFRENGITHRDVMRILHDEGLGLPEYYSWRSRSGCYFCFFQRTIEWLGLLRTHPDLFDRAARFEHYNSQTGEKYTWADGESLDDLRKPERQREIEEYHRKMMEWAAARPDTSRSLQDAFEAAIRLQEREEACLICRL
ncbi:MAG: phosphoadenosine phosphosulfate reductase family protein [Armatimonadota bacterium]